jgi:hypothetical protein
MVEWVPAPAQVLGHEHQPAHTLGHERRTQRSKFTKYLATNPSTYYLDTNPIPDPNSWPPNHTMTP